MLNQNPLEPQEEEYDKDLNFELPKSIRLLISVPTVLLILLILGVYFYLIFCNPCYIDPEKFGFSLILTTLIAILIVINIPWGKLGFRIKKIGMIELENIVKVQAKDNSKELADLQKQIDDLKIKINDPVEKIGDTDIDELVIKFLKQYSEWAFSGLRIKKWGAKQTGFEEFGKYEPHEIRESLRRLLSKNKVLTRISKKGNTIYKIK